MITHQPYNPTNEELTRELNFMYVKYEQLCAAYKRLATEKGIIDPSKEAHDMSHMTFEEKPIM